MWFNGREMTAASDIDSLPDQREVEIEPGAFARTALDANLPRMLLNDSVTHRQTQPRAPRLAFARRLGGEERVIDALDVLLCDSRPGVRNYHADPVSIGGSDPQRAAV